MNCNVTAECAYKEKSKNFHSFSDENGNRYGLGFHKSESGLKQATQFCTLSPMTLSLCPFLHPFSRCFCDDANPRFDSGFDPLCAVFSVFNV